MKKYAVLFLLLALVACGESYSQGTTTDTTATHSDKIIQANSTLAKGKIYTPLLYVPAGKVFIMTDIYADAIDSESLSFTFYQNDVYVYAWTFHNTFETHFTSGIPFMPGSNVVVYAQLSDIIIRYSGYFTSSAPYNM